MIELPDDARVILCDIWGCIHDGSTAFPGAIAALARWRDEGRVVILVTNAPRPNALVVQQLHALGVGDRCFDAVVTSGDTGMAYVARHGGEADFIGTADDHASLAAAGLALVGADRPLVVCTGLDEQRPAPADYDGQLAAMRARDATLVCLNPDRVVIHAGIRDICAGAIADRYIAIGGTVEFTGKPFAPIYRRALDLAAGVLGRDVDAGEVIAIGDGIVTDMAGAARMGFRFLFVSDGIERERIAEAGLDPVLQDAREEHDLADFWPHATVDRLS